MSLLLATGGGPPPPSNPPFMGGARVPLAVLLAWLPPQPQPITVHNLNPPISGPVQTQVPVGTSVPRGVLAAWDATRDYPSQSARNLAPALTVSNPPFNGGARVSRETLNAWIPPDPPFQTARNLNPILTVSNPPLIGSRIPQAVLNSWLPPDPLPTFPVKYPIQPTAPPSFVTVGMVIPQAVLNSYDWALIWPWARTPVVTPSGPTPTNPPFPGTKLSTEVQSWWLPGPPVVAPPVVLPPQPVVQANVPAASYGSLEAILAEWQRQQPSQQPRRLVTPPSAPDAGLLTGARIHAAVLISWLPPPPAFQVAINLDPPIQGPVGALIDGSATLSGIGAVYWRAQGGRYRLEDSSGDYLLEDLSGFYILEQVNLVSGASQISGAADATGLTGVDLRFVSTPQARSQVSTPNVRVVVSSPQVRYTLTTPNPRTAVSTPGARTTITSPQGPIGMPQGNDFSDADTSETVTNTWNFAPWLGPGVTINTPTTTCTLRSGTDASPSSRLLTNPIVVASPTNGKAAQAVQQQVQALQPGACYIMSATANTSDGQTLSVWAYQRGKLPS